jgi:hypothetical protein
VVAFGHTTGEPGAGDGTNCVVYTVVASACISTPTEILPGLWRVEAVHPEWTAEDNDDSEPGWDPKVGWLALEIGGGLLLIDPLVEDWAWLDGRVAAAGGCGGIVRTIHWHQRTVTAASNRYDAEVWARKAPPDLPAESLDQAVADAGPMPGGVIGYWLADGDELALWLPAQKAMVFGDAMIRERDGTLQRCPDSWPDLGHRRPERLRADLQQLVRLQPRHVVVSHGPAVLGDGPAAFERAVTADAGA